MKDKLIWTARKKLIICKKYERKTHLRRFGMMTNVCKTAKERMKQKSIEKVTKIRNTGIQVDLTQVQHACHEGQERRCSKSRK